MFTIVVPSKKAEAQEFKFSPTFFHPIENLKCSQRLTDIVEYVIIINALRTSLEKKRDF